MAEPVKKPCVEAVACADGVYGNDLYWFDHCPLKSLLDDRAATELADGIDDLYRPALDVIVGQLMGLYSSVAAGLRPDAPSPGTVISRVVQEFQI